MEALIWILTGALMLVGLLGVVLPLLPGTTLILAAAVLHRLLLPGYLEWWHLGLLGGLWLLSVGVDVLGTAIGARMGGGGRWGMAGAAGGSVVGVFISLPAVLLGSVLGAILAERLLARREPGAALRAGIGAGLGFLVSTFFRVLIAFAMILLFILLCLSAAEPGWVFA